MRASAARLGGLSAHLLFGVDKNRTAGDAVVEADSRLAERTDTEVYHAGTVLTGWPYWFM